MKLITWEKAFKAFIVLSLLLSPPQIYAQEEATGSSSIAIANYYEIQDQNVEDGSTISSYPEGYSLSKIEYDPLMIGVISLNPGIAISLTSQSEKNYPVVSSGNTYVRISTINGNIKKGDYLATSSIQGVAMKAEKSGYVMGTALEDYSAESKDDIGKIATALNLHYQANKGASAVSSSLTDILKLSAIAATESPSAVFKYFIAGLVVIIGFIMSFLSFGRTANKGIEALGRNPFAGKMIQLGIFFNVVVAIVIVLIGIVTSFLILKL